MLKQIIDFILSIFLHKRKQDNYQNWHNNTSVEDTEVKRLDKPIQENIPTLESPIWVYPVTIQRVTSPYGWRTLLGKKVWHNGTDFTGRNDYCVAPTDCVVTKILKPDTEYPVKFRFDTNMGKFVKIENIPTGRAWTPYVMAVCAFDRGIRFLFKHIDAEVNIGDYLKPGETVGRIGNLGYSMGKHLHFEIQNKVINGWKNVDPIKFLNKKIKLEQSGEILD